MPTKNSKKSPSGKPAARAAKAPSAKRAAAAKKPADVRTAAPARLKRKFSIDELKAINTALLANPATKNPVLVDRVMNILNDPGVTRPPKN